MIRSFGDIATGRMLTPDTEGPRLRRIRVNRQYYEGGTLTQAQASQGGRLPANWFRKVVTIYPEFMFQDRPTITIRDNDRMTQAVADLETHLWDVMWHASVDMLRYGTGIIASDPYDPLLFRAFQPDQWMQVWDGIDAEPQGDVVFWLSGVHPYQQAAVVKYETDGPARLEVYDYNGSTLKLNRSRALAPRQGRQTVRLFHGYHDTEEGLSLMTDIVENVSEITSVLGLLSQNISRNSRPHLFGPDGMLQLDEKGNVELDVQGQFLPVTAGEVLPGYLQWDSQVEAVRQDLDFHFKTIFAMTGLPPTFFDTSVRTGVLTGVALRRLFTPFLSKAYYLQQAFQRGIVDLLELWNGNRAANGMEAFAFDERDVEIEWQFEQAFGLLEEEALQEQAQANAAGINNRREGGDERRAAE